MCIILFFIDFFDVVICVFIYVLCLVVKIDVKIVILYVFQKLDLSGLFYILKSLEDFYNFIDFYEFENYWDVVLVLDKIQDE